MDAKELDAAMRATDSRFLESSDLMATEPCTLEIADVHAPGTIMVPDTKSEKKGAEKPLNFGVLSFAGTSKMFIVKPTNRRLIKSILGPRASTWVGKKITIGVRYLEQAFGEWNVPCLRVIPPQGVPIENRVRPYYGAEKPYKK